MSDPIEPSPFAEYDLVVNGETYTVLDPEGADYHRIRLPDGQVTSCPGAPAEVLTAEALADHLANPPAPVVPVPESVTPRQIRRALNAAGLRETVESAVAAEGQDARDDWEFALEIRRDHPLLVGMAAGLGLSSEQVDDLFRAAAAIET